MPTEQPSTSNVAKAYLAGGCFWGLEDLFRELHGVRDTEVGYMGGSTPNPTYQSHEGHAEALEITYDPQAISYRELLLFFFKVHNPTTLNRQGNDIGTSYRSAIFYQNERELDTARATIEYVDQSGVWDQPVVTQLEAYQTFYPAEDYHQDYLVHNPGGYTCHMVYFDDYE